MNIARDSSFTLNASGAWIANGGSQITLKHHAHGASFINNGDIEALGGKVTLNAAVSGTGTFEISADANGGTGTLAFGDAVGAGETVHLNAGLLELERPMAFLAAIEDFNANGKIELVGTIATRAAYSDGTLNLFDHHRLVASLDLPGDFKSDDFRLQHEHGNTFVTLGSPTGAETAFANLCPNQAHGGPG
jgi:hypothetical protein